MTLSAHRILSISLPSPPLCLLRASVVVVERPPLIILRAERAGITASTRLLLVVQSTGYELLVV